METEKCKITLNSPENIYFAGQQIKGQVSLTLIKRTKIRGIKFRITGKGKCNWVEFLRRDSQVLSSPTVKPNPRSIIYTAKETYLLEELYIFGTNNGRPIELDPGEHNYDLSYELDKNLPSSFSGSHGSIKYKVKFIIEKPWTLNEKYTIPITIVKSFIMPPALVHTPTPGFFQVTKNVGLFNGGPISLAAELPKSYVVRGDKLKLKVTVENKSSTHVDRLKFSIRQIVTYYSEQPLCLKKDQITKLFKKETGGIQKKTTREYEHEIQVPSCQPSDAELSKIIHIKYEIQVEAFLPGLHKNILVSLPFFVCSAEYDGNIGPNGIGWFAYPNPNISIYSEQSAIESPSHSMYSDNQSIYSSNYDSSISDDSVRLSLSTSARGSFRNSIGFDLQQRLSSSDGNNTGTLNHQRNHSISNSNPSNYQQYCPELPPSYEELFGNPSTSATPSAPPLSTSSPTGTK